MTNLQPLSEDVRTQDGTDTINGYGTMTTTPPPSSSSQPRSWHTFLTSLIPQARYKTTKPAIDTLDWPSMLVIYFIIFASEACRGIIIPSQWPYLHSLGGSKSQLGIFVASFSFGRMVSTIPLGYLSDHLSMRTVFYTCSLLQILGNMIYVLAPNATVLILCRMVVGVGSATMSICRAHVTRVTSKEQRTFHFAYLSALQFLGFAVLPGMGGIIAMWPETHSIVLNQYTYPGYIQIMLNLIAVGLLYYVYLDAPEQNKKNKKKDDDEVKPLALPAASSSGGVPNNETQAETGTNGLVQVHIVGEEAQEEEKPDWYALVICLFINLCFRGIVAELETLASPFLMEQFPISLSAASTVIGSLGFLGLGVYLSFRSLSDRISDRELVAIGLVLNILGASILTLVQANILPHSLWIYSLALGLIWSLAYPLGQTAVLGLFSKILAGLPAGGMMGVFSAAGSLARVIFAMFSAFLWSYFGSNVVNIQMIILSALILALTVISYPHLVPHAFHNPVLAR